MNNSYPPHLTNNQRAEVVKSLILHEIKKLLPSLPKDHFSFIESDIRGWLINPSKYNLEEIRDFWNGADGIMNGFKLKNIIPLISAQNVTWSTVQQVEINELRFTADLGDLQINNKQVKEVADILKANEGKLKEKSDQSFSSDISRELDPIIVVKEPNGFFAHDGNGRVIRTFLYKRPSLLAYIGERNIHLPENPWIPTMRLIEIVDFYKSKAIDLEALHKLLFPLLKKSESAVYEFRHRVDFDQNLKEQILNNL